MVSLSLLMFTTHAAVAADIDGHNLGSVPCEQYMAALIQSPEKEITYYYWAQGFMTGLNQDLIRAVPRHLYDVENDPQGQRAKLKAFCVAHPKAPFGDAVNALYPTLFLVDRLSPPPK